jgi:hypothetical protein
MREIKFRAWFNGKIHDEVVILDPVFCLEEKDMGCPLNAGIADFLSRDEPSTPMVLMQYTGLHDKNGKEIYEGDVIDFGRTYLYSRTEKVEWLEGAAGFSPFTDDDEAEGQAIYPEPCQCEVIGNIYENPELLEAKV